MSESDILSSVPTLQQIEAAAIAKERALNPPNDSYLNQGTSEQSSRGRSFLESLGLKDNLVMHVCIMFEYQYKY